MKYFNVKNKYGTETVDCLDRNDFKTYKEYKEELRSMLYNYRLMGQPVYLSQRKVK